MSCFTIIASSLISWAGSSNMEVRLASCASFCNFCDVLWIPMPILDALLANSDVEEAVPGRETDIEKGLDHQHKTCLLIRGILHTDG